MLTHISVGVAVRGDPETCCYANMMESSLRPPFFLVNVWSGSGSGHGWVEG
jgi:hypothetical protein